MKKAIKKAAERCRPARILRGGREDWKAAVDDRESEVNCPIDAERMNDVEMRGLEVERNIFACSAFAFLAGVLMGPLISPSFQCP